MKAQWIALMMVAAIAGCSEDNDGVSGGGNDVVSDASGDSVTDDVGPGPDGDASVADQLATADGDGEDVSPDAQVTQPDADSDSQDATEPDATEPDATEPDATEPDATEPDATEPDATEPDATEPDATEPDATEPDATEPDATEPDATEPDATEPDATEPQDAGPPPEPTEDWLNLFGGAGPEEVKAVAVDSQGNVYVAGIFRAETLTIGTESFEPADTDPQTADAFVASFDPSGGFRWATAIGAVDSEIPYGLAVDAQDRLIVAGSFMADLNIGGTLVENADSEDIFVAVYDADGVLLWAKGYGGPTGEAPRAVAVDAAGDIYLTGAYNGTITVDDFVVGTVDDYGLSEIFVCKIDAESHDALWLTTFEGMGHDVGTAIAVTPEGQVVAGLSYQNDLTIEENAIVFDTLTSLNFNAAIVRLDEAGALLWAHDIGGAGSEEIRGIGIHDDGRIYVGGLYTEAAEFGGAVLPSIGVYDLAVAAYAPDGGHLWSNGFGGEGISQGLHLDVEADGVYFTGRFKGDLNLGVEYLVATQGDYDVFVARFDPDDGSPVWAKSIGGPGEDQANGIAVGSDGSVFVAGHSEGDVPFAGSTTAPPGGWLEGFILGISQ